MTHEHASLFTDEELDVKIITKTIAMHDKDLREQIAQEVQQRHDDGSDFDKNWTNHHGLDRCDCDDLVAFIRGKNE
jgi:hypothetical protein